MCLCLHRNILGGEWPVTYTAYSLCKASYMGFRVPTLKVYLLESAQWRELRCSQLELGWPLYGSNCSVFVCETVCWCTKINDTLLKRCAKFYTLSTLPLYVIYFFFFCPLRRRVSEGFGIGKWAFIGSTGKYRRRKHCDTQVKSIHCNRERICPQIRPVALRHPKQQTLKRRIKASTWQSAAESQGSSVS